MSAHFTQHQERHFALIPAAGIGARLSGALPTPLPKQYLLLAGKPMLQYALDTFAAHAAIAHSFVVVGADDVHIDAFLAAQPQLTGKVTVLRHGGKTRQESVRNGLQAIRAQVGDDDWVLVHDAARPGLNAALLDKLITTLHDHDVGGLLALPLVDTLKRSAGGQVQATVPRQHLWTAQTPQMFRYDLLLRALTQCALAGDMTDDASAIEMLGLQPKLVEGSPRNFKVTLAHDIALAESFLQASTPPPALLPALHPALPPFRIGQGYDCHALVNGRKLIIGGVTIPHTTGLFGHSDADVLLHAITDALFGSAALGDIGRHFPDTDEQFKGADSRALLREAVKRVTAAGYRVGNLDATIIAQAPRMAPHIPQMTANVAADLGVTLEQVNIKAKTNEKLGYLGREEGIAAEALVLVYPK